MISTIRKITVVLAIILITYLGYEAFFHDSARKWKNYNQPQLASYTSLEQDGEILEELDRQTRYGSYKPLDPTFFVKPNIFKKIER